MTITDNTFAAADFRIEDASTVTLNGSKKIIFKAFQRKGDAFVHVGQFSAPARTAKRDLWKIAAAVTY
jgi:hypothetical protein